MFISVPVCVRQVDSTIKRVEAKWSSPIKCLHIASALTQHEHTGSCRHIGGLGYLATVPASQAVDDTPAKDPLQ